MFVKVLVLCLILGVCCGFPLEDVKHPMPIGVPPKRLDGVPPNPSKNDNSDLKTDPSTWWHSSWWHTYPVYYYHHVPHPTYNYWHHYY